MKKKWIARYENLASGEMVSHVFDSKSEAEHYLSDIMADSIQDLGQDAGEEGESILEVLSGEDVESALELYEEYNFEDVLLERFGLEEAIAHE